MRFIALILACSLFVGVAQAEQMVYTIKKDGGGITTEYQAKYEQWSKQGAKVIIDGECASACTLVVSTKYNLDVCATDNAQLLFHKPFYITKINDKTLILRGTYYRKKSNSDWIRLFVDVMPSSIRKVFLTAPIPSVYDGDGQNDMRGWNAPKIFKHVKKC
ncbi:signal peptide protein [Sinorhizobium phage phiM7]|uniref:Uncharacterized protein n=2 Tax=Emdodecavirus TaxID=1980937 RepID=S5M796_9CAUD|nr:hypothetical protein AB690_gp281 [Sinorhizobium phage phiM12]YP_009601350.1 signal peptide protein [Sinorhizobium phage phiM7]AGR47931.1 hypothetical protein SmphiM12_299 [Sinorhizobium phage phiM12]AKF12770.1 signal peptide protein [Sinorhizobium phage phiM7]AKF13131.1 signal peptide protein [Sinorhizobium phage phiM19]